MATNPRLRIDLLKRLKITKQALSLRVKKVRDKCGPMLYEHAAYVIAHQEGMELTKYLDEATIDKVRGLIGSREQTPGSTIKKVVHYNKINIIRIDDKLPQVDLLLSTTIAEDAKKMAKVYFLSYALENSIRAVVRMVLERKYDKDWWVLKAPSGIKKDATKRIREDDVKPWHGKRGQHEIYYSDFKDLKSIISANWQDFEPILEDREWIMQRLKDLEHPRNIIAHHNPLSADDATRIRLFYSEWAEFLKKKKEMFS